MCIAEQSGACKAGGPAHEHSWSNLNFKVALDTSSRSFSQLRGDRDDGQRFFQTMPYDYGRAIFNPEYDRQIRQELQRRLDLELKCCLCLGDEHQQQVA